MSILIKLFIIGVSLSMDTFSISLSIGLLSICNKKMLFLVTLVGIMHFFMPLLGLYFGYKITNLLNINVNLLLGIILIFIGIEMFIELFKKEENKIELNILNLLLISISVSLDSFSTGLALHAITNNSILAGVIFSICAASFTFIGLLIGKYSNKKMGIYGNIFGILLLFILGIIHLFK